MFPSSADHVGEFLHGVDGMSFHEVVNIRQGCCHSPSEWGVPRRDLERVDPHQPMRHPLEPLHLGRKLVGIASVPAIGQDDDDRISGEPAHSPFIVELAEPDPELRPATPIEYSLAGIVQRHIRVTAVQLPRDPSEASAEGERFDFLAAGDSGVHKSQQRSRVRFHRAADIEDEDEAAQALGWRFEVTLDRLAAGFD